jgi:hypothetical protein
MRRIVDELTEKRKRLVAMYKKKSNLIKQLVGLNDELSMIKNLS